MIHITALFITGIYAYLTWFIWQNYCVPFFDKYDNWYIAILRFPIIFFIWFFSILSLYVDLFESIKNQA